VARKRQVVEVGSTGVDEYLQGLSSSAFPSPGNPSGAGLRVPSFVAGPIVNGIQQPTPRFLFCLASVTTRGKGRIRGIRQGLKIGLDTQSGTLPLRLLEAWVKTPDFRFVDGNVSWHLVKEPTNTSEQSKLTDTSNWKFRQSHGPAMLYETFTNSNVTTTGAPVIYSQGLTAYTAPNVATSWTDLGGLGTMYDIRFPWDNAMAWNSLDIEVECGRFSLYASILQTNPATRKDATFFAPTPPANSTTNTLAFAVPEEMLLSQYANNIEGSGVGVNFTRIFGSIIFEEFTS
jgi:hypothetical protein